MLQPYRIRSLNRKVALRRAAVTICPVIVILCMTIFSYRFYRPCFVTNDGSRFATVGEIFTDSQTLELVRALLRLDTDTAEQLIEQGADINARGESEVTPLLYFIAHAKVEAAELALRLGADPDFAADGIETALDFALQTDRWQELMKILVNAGADVGMASDLSQLSPRNSSIELRVLNKLKWDVFRAKGEAGAAGPGAENGGRPETKAPQARTKPPQAETAEPLLWLLDHGGDVNAQDYMGYTLLSFADGWHELTLELLERGANPFVKSIEGRSFAQWFETDKANKLNRPEPFSEVELEQRRPIQEKIALLRQDPQKIREARDIDAAYAQFLEVYRRTPHGARNLRDLEDIGGVVEKLENPVEQAKRKEGERGAEDR